MWSVFRQCCRCQSGIGSDDVRVDGVEGNIDVLVTVSVVFYVITVWNVVLCLCLLFLTWLISRMCGARSSRI